MMTGLLFLLCCVLCGIPASAYEDAEASVPVIQLDRWQEHYLQRVQQFREENAALDPETRYVVFVGDSLTEAYPLEVFYPDMPTLDRGIVSDGIIANRPDVINRGVLNRMGPSLLDCQPAAMVLTIGTNQMPHEQYSLEELRDGVAEIVEMTRAHHPGLPIILNTIAPVGRGYKQLDYFQERARAFNSLLKEYAEAEGLPIVDLYAAVADEEGYLRADWTGDNLHISRAGYAAWTEKLKPVIEQAIRPRE